MKYKAFISYRRSDASVVASWLRRRLLAFRPPAALIERLPERSRRDFDSRASFFLDTTYEIANEDFWTKNIEPALRDSQFLIVVSSPAALVARDDGSENWVAREIDTFLAIHGEEEGRKRILVVLAPGARPDRFPGRLGELAERWDWADFRMLSPWRWLKPGSVERSSDAFLKIAAALFAVPQDLLPALRQEEARRRGRIRLMAGGAAFAVTVILAGALAWAVVERGNAVRNYEAARNSVDRLVAVVAAGLRDLQGVDVQTIERALDQVARLVDDLARANPDDPQLDRSKAAMLYEFAKTYQSARATVAAQRKADESLKLRTALVQALPDVPELRAELADSLDLDGDLLRFGKKHSEARIVFAQALALRSSLLLEVAGHRDRANWLLGLSKSHVRLGDTDIDEGTQKPDGDSARQILIQSAVGHYQASLAHSARLYIEDHQSQTSRRELSWSFNKDGDVKARLGFLEPAIASYENALCLRRGLRLEDFLQTKWASDVSWTLQRLAAVRLRMRNTVEAELNLLEVVRIRQVLVTQDKRGDLVLVQELAIGLVQLAEYKKQNNEPETVVALLTGISSLSERLKAAGGGKIPDRLSLPDTGKLHEWVQSQFSSEDLRRHQRNSEAILNPIFQEAANIASPGTLDECRAKVNVALQALTLPDVRL